MTVSVTVDFVLFGVFPELTNSGVRILLVQRGKEPFKGQWAIPGGFLEDDELLSHGAQRELFEETGLDVTPTFELHPYADVDRDPRGRVISFPFSAVIRLADFPEPVGADDADEARWFDLADLPDMDLAFDHADIIRETYVEVVGEMYSDSTAAYLAILSRKQNS